MKIPASKLKSKDLETLFQQSSIVEQYFFPREVPSLFPSEEDKRPNNPDASITIQGKPDEKPLENN